MRLLVLLLPLVLLLLLLLLLLLRLLLRPLNLAPCDQLEPLLRSRQLPLARQQQQRSPSCREPPCLCRLS